MSGSKLLGGMQLAAASAPLVAGYFAKRDQDDLARQAKKDAKKQERLIDQKMAMRADPTNPYANLGVATKAAEMKIQEADQSLANALDTIRATGGGAASATALARAAAQSKQTIAADIETQEISNQQKFAEGEKLRQEEVASREELELDIAADRADREWQRQADALSAAQASQQAGLSGAMGIGSSIMENPDNVKALFGG